MRWTVLLVFLLVLASCSGNSTPRNTVTDSPSLPEGQVAEQASPYALSFSNNLVINSAEVCPSSTILTEQQSAVYANQNDETIIYVYDYMVDMINYTCANTTYIAYRLYDFTKEVTDLITNDTTPQNITGQDEQIDALSLSGAIGAEESVELNGNRYIPGNYFGEEGIIWSFENQLYIFTNRDTTDPIFVEYIANVPSDFGFQPELDITQNVNKDFINVAKVVQQFLDENPDVLVNDTEAIDQYLYEQGLLLE